MLKRHRIMSGKTIAEVSKSLGASSANAYGRLRTGEEGAIHIETGRAFNGNQFGINTSLECGVGKSSTDQ